MSPSQPLRTIAVAGASGHAGREIVRALSARGVRVRALVRSPHRLGPILELCDQIHTVEVTDPASLRGSLDGADALLSAVGKTRQKDPTPRRVVDVDANRYLFEEAARAGVRKIGFLSVAGAAHDHPAAMVRMKADAEDALKQTGVSYLIVRPGGYFSDLWEGFAMCRYGLFFCLRDRGVRFNPISLEDLGEFVAHRFLDPAESRLVLPVGGPQVLRMPDIAAIAARILHRKVTIIPIPMSVAKGGVALLRPFSRNAWELGQFFVETLDYAGRHPEAMLLPACGTLTLEQYFRRRYAEESPLPIRSLPQPSP